MLRPPRADNPCHRLALHVGLDVREAEIDLAHISPTSRPYLAPSCPASPRISPRSPLDLPQVREAEIDLDLRSHAVIPLYAYDAEPHISPISRLCLAHLSPLSRLYLAYGSPLSRLYLL